MSSLSPVFVSAVVQAVEKEAQLKSSPTTTVQFARTIVDQLVQKAVQSASKQVAAADVSAEDKEKSSADICQFSSLSKEMQAEALTAISKINHKTSTVSGTTWANYNWMIESSVQDPAYAKHVLLARINNQFVGYVAFKPPIQGMAYCRWLAVDEAYKKQKIGQRLQLHIFKIVPDLQGFFEEIRSTNAACLGLLKSFEKLGYTTILSERPNWFDCHVMKSKK